MLARFGDGFDDRRAFDGFQLLQFCIKRGMARAGHRYLFHHSLRTFFGGP